MSYLIMQMWICLLIAAAIGALVGWLLRGISHRRQLKELEDSWQNKFAKKYTESVTTLDEETDSAAKTNNETPIPNKNLQSSFDVEEIEGIGNSYGSKLRDVGITTTQQLLDKCSNLEGRIEIANHIGIEDFVIQKWASMADLMRISEIEGQFAELIVYAGVDSVQMLGEQDVNSLFNTLNKTNTEQQRVKKLPDSTSLEIMIAEAKSLPVKMKDV